ncbi:predicted protein [Verticillium alfalfae VaMs.102]|uniref:Predicted protein n=1 Tax=Verticillium alfalfae (strain VaMs.102 / ATCC MYA-4576 / FGSC 10136) TaxID=526221 RepID=C9SGQ8_VERA1|nr:predicted protein [Verticillium alfalfae VaMs.102]EEY17553.1 predicted protein [Verticillium alfalfae VaMs.102]
MRVVLLGMTSCSGPLLTGPNATDQLAREATDEAGFDPRLAGEGLVSALWEYEQNIFLVCHCRYRSWRIADAKRRLRGAALEGSAACADRGGSDAGGRGKLRACRLKKSMLREVDRRGFGERLVSANFVCGRISGVGALVLGRGAALQTAIWVTNCRHSFRSDGRAIAQPDSLRNKLELLSDPDATYVEAKDPSAGLACQGDVSEL